MSKLRDISGYILSERIGSGGMGDVYRAWHPGLKREAAVKILHQPEMAERFRNEAFIQASIDHPHIVKLYECSLEGSSPYIIMEYVEGESLDAYIARKGRVSNEVASEILKQVASALSYLHGRDILHRDIKPQNFKLRWDGVVKMLDFGIARNSQSPKLTLQGYIVGTAEYMSPEQFQQKVEKQSDMWSLGVMLYEMLTGHLPFDGTDPFLLQARIGRASYTDPRILASGLSPLLARIIEKCLRVNPASRISSHELVALLRKAVPSANKGKETRPGKNRLSIAVICSTVLLGIVLFWQVFSTDTATVPAAGEDKAAPAPDAGTVQVKINAPSVSNAIIVFSNGETRPLPHQLSGREGERIQFTIRAEGYHERPVLLGITNRRSSYEYNLEKINE